MLTALPLTLVSAKAIRLDRNGLDSLESYINILYGFNNKDLVLLSGRIMTTTSKHIKESELSSVCDILDALTRGYAIINEKVLCLKRFLQTSFS